MDLNALQLVITFVGTIGFPVFAFFIKARITESLLGFKLELSKQLSDYRQEAAVREATSNMRYTDLERRIAVTESGHSSISNRLDNQQMTLNHIAGVLENGQNGQRRAEQRH